MFHLERERERKRERAYRPGRIFVAFIGVGGLENQRSIDVASKASRWRTALSKL